VALAALFLALGSRGLETAIANGDTRTLTLHHIHTEENITITYKRDGKYDEEALKKLDWFVRDWREEESTHMDPHLFDLVWEVAREVGSDQPIHVVCGYRSPKTNAMLRHRSSGVAQFSQHMLGKAMDFYIPGAALEDLRIAGLRLQRGGVGYYPTSGSPFVHLDVGSVRHWPRMTHEQLARVFPNGRTVHVPSDGQPLAGYALALADIEKRGSSAPSQTSLSAAHAAGIVTPAVHRQPTVGKDDEEEIDVAVPVARAATAARRNTYSLASTESRPVEAKAVETKPEPVQMAVRLPAPRPARVPTQPAEAPLDIAPAIARAPVAATSGRWAYATEAPRPPQTIKSAVLTEADITGAPPPGREADTDHVPLDMVLAYAAQTKPERETLPVLRPEPVAEAPLRNAASVAKMASLRDGFGRDNVTTVPKKTFARPVTAEPVARPKPPVVPANPGMRYDDPWLRAMIVTPSLSSGMTATLYGDPDFSELRSLMKKPTATLMMSFSDEPYPGIAPSHFSGEAVVFLTTRTFDQRRTASLH
jgi:uncharacterized protein YcbK (DUF882 family)